jgi:hypothetical protein
LGVIYIMKHDIVYLFITRGTPPQTLRWIRRRCGEAE